MKNETKIGILFLLFCGVMVWLTVTMRGCPLTPKTVLHIRFPSLEGLKRGDDVIYRGVPIGKVSDVRLSLEGGVATCQLEKDAVYDPDTKVCVIPEWVEAYVEDTTVLGGKRIVMLPRDVPPGTRHVPLPIEKPGGYELETGKVREPIARVASVIAERIANLLEPGGPIAKVAENLERAADDVAAITNRVRSGEGALGKLINDPRLYDNIDKFFDEGAKLVEQARRGDGAIGRLLNDPEIGRRLDTVTKALAEPRGTVGKLLHESTLHDAAERSLDRLGDMLDHVHAGNGTLGRLYTDPRLYDNAADTLEHADAILRDVRAGKGTVGRLFEDDALYRNLLDITDNLKAVSDKLNSDQGTLGMLINDRRFFDKAEKAVTDLGDIGAAFKAFRTFAGVGYTEHSKQDLSVTRLYVRVEPSPDKFFYGGVAILGFDKRGDIAFDGQFDGERADDSKLVPEAAIGWRFFDRHLTFRMGFIEGKLGGGLDLEFSIPGLGVMPIRLTIEGRLPYNDEDFDDDDINEDVHPMVLRAYASVLLVDRLRVYAGANNFFDRVGFTWGVSFEYRDEDIRSMVGFLALGS